MGHHLLNKTLHHAIRQVLYYLVARHKVKASGKLEVQEVAVDKRNTTCFRPRLYCCRVKLLIRPHLRWDPIKFRYVAWIKSAHVQDTERVVSNDS